MTGHTIRASMEALAHDARIWENLSDRLTEMAAEIDGAVLDSSAFGRNADSVRTAYATVIELTAQYAQDASTTAQDAASGLREIARILSDVEDRNYGEVAALWREKYEEQ